MAAFLALLVPASTSAAARNPPAPREPSQPLRDGCQRSDYGVLSRTSPEWVYVSRSPATRTAEGIIRASYVALTDEPLAHSWFDFSADLALDHAFGYLLGGSPGRRTGNFQAQSPHLHFEWESGTLPTFAWPTDGDRVKLWGSWIWDCAHWTASPVNQPGSPVTGEETEFHPLNAIAVQRHAPYRPSRTETETDVFISNDGTQAHAVEQCALTHHPVAPDRYDAGFYGCSGAPGRQIQPLARHYSFFVPAPSPSPPGARLKWHADTMSTGSTGREHVRVLGDGINVAVVMPRSRHRVRYGRSFFVSWSGPQPHPTRLRVTLHSILINHADPDLSDQDKSPPGWNLYLELNGYWKLLNDWVPGLYAVADGERLTSNRTITINVPRGAGVRLQVSGRECDIPGGTIFSGTFVPIVHPCPANTDEIRFANDDPGTVRQRFSSPAASLGTRTVKSTATGASAQGTDDYEITYSVQRG